MSTSRSRALRNDMTKAERRLWSILRMKQLGVKFRRQEPIGSYIVDFVCYEAKLIIEVDGGQHAEQTAKLDRRRDAWLEGEGFRVLRFWNVDVMENLEGVHDRIAAALGLPPP